MPSSPKFTTKSWNSKLKQNCPRTTYSSHVRSPLSPRQILKEGTLLMHTSSPGLNPRSS